MSFINIFGSGHHIDFYDKINTFRREGDARFLKGLGGEQGTVNSLTACASKHLTSALHHTFDLNRDQKLSMEVHKS